MNSKVHRLIDLILVAALLVTVAVHLLSVSSHGRTTVLVTAALLNALLVSIGVRLMFSVLYGWENMRTLCAAGTVAATVGVVVLLVGELSGSSVMVLALDQAVNTARVASKGTVELPFSARLRELSAEPTQPVFVLLPRRPGPDNETKRHPRVEPAPDRSLDFGESGRYRIERILHHARLASYALTEPRRLEVYSHDSLWRTVEITEPGVSIARPEGDTIVVAAFVDNAGAYLKNVDRGGTDEARDGAPPCSPGIVIDVREERGSARYLLSVERTGAPAKLDSSGSVPPCPETRLVIPPIAAMRVRDRPDMPPHTAVVLTSVSGGDSIVLVEGCARTERVLLPAGDTLKMVVPSPLTCRAAIEITTETGSSRVTLTHGDLVPHEGVRFSLIGCHPTREEAIVRLRRSPRGPLGVGAAVLIALGLMLTIADTIRNRAAQRPARRPQGG